MNKDKRKKVAIITGASKGLGRHLAVYFAKKDMKIIAIARSKDKLSSLTKEISNSGGNASYYDLDITDHASLKEVMEDIKEKYSFVDILINNAGTGNAKPLEELNPEEIDKIIDINLKGTIYATQLVVPIMKDSPGIKYIFNISSMSGERGLNNNGIYHASKFGVNGFSNSMSKYLIPYDIHVVTLCPGGINTSWWEKNEDWAFDKDKLMEPDEVSRTIDFILKGRGSTLFQKIQFFPTCVVERW